VDGVAGLTPEQLQHQFAGRAGMTGAPQETQGIAVPQQPSLAAEARPTLETLARLNRAAAETATAMLPRVHAMTDVTGFGLVGHGLGMTRAGGVALRVALSSLPLYARVREMHAAGVTTGSTKPNREGAAGRVRGTLDSFWDALVHDPQTSGGLLIAVDGAAADDLVSRLHDAGVEHAVRIGEVLASDQPFLEFVGGS